MFQRSSQDELHLTRLAALWVAPQAAQEGGTAGPGGTASPATAGVFAAGTAIGTAACCAAAARRCIQRHQVGKQQHLCDLATLCYQALNHHVYLPRLPWLRQRRRLRSCHSNCYRRTAAGGITVTTSTSISWTTAAAVHNVPSSTATVLRGGAAGQADVDNRGSCRSNKLLNRHCQLSILAAAASVAGGVGGDS
jgi:hypothetical protein